MSTTTPPPAPATVAQQVDDEAALIEQQLTQAIEEGTSIRQVAQDAHERAAANHPLNR